MELELRNVSWLLWMGENHTQTGMMFPHLRPLLVRFRFPGPLTYRDGTKKKPPQGVPDRQGMAQQCIASSLVCSRRHLGH